MATQYPEARVLIVMTGGTICMKESPEGNGLVPARGFLEEGMKPIPSFNDGSHPEPLPVMSDPSTKTYLPSLRTPPSTYSRHVRYTLYEFPTLLDSSSISSSGWTQIASTIQNNYALYDGFVVLHGTDSLAYTSSALSFMLLHLGKPVILTGSQASIFALQSDAVDNLLGSLIIAGTFIIPEVCLFFHHNLYRGNRCTKVSATSFDAFASPNCPPLATVSALGAEVNWNLIRRPKTLKKFTIQTNLDTAHVACLRVFPGIKPEMIDSVLKMPNLRGLILETFGAGNAPSGEDGILTRVIGEGVKRGVVIVNVSQCQSGFVSPLYAPGTALGQAGVVFGHDLTTEAALTKLSYLLALPPSPSPSRSHSPTPSMSHFPPPSYPSQNPTTTDHPPTSTSHSERAIPTPSHTPSQSLTTTTTNPPTHTHTPTLTPGPSTPFHNPRLIANQMTHSLRGEMTSLHAPTFSHPEEEIPNMTVQQANFTALAWAIANGDEETVENMLEGKQGAWLVGGEDYLGNTALHLAATASSPTILKMLLERGASVHRRNRAGNTPLFLAKAAAVAGNVVGKEMVGLLEKTGAMLHVEEREGRRRGSVDRGVGTDVVCARLGFE